MLYFPREYFFSRTLFTLYHQRIIHEPRMNKKSPTRKPRRAGLKSIAIPMMTQKIQKKSIGKNYAVSIWEKRDETRKNPNQSWDLS
jgi:hypothetical protein